MATNKKYFSSGLTGFVILALVAIMLISCAGTTDTPPPAKSQEIIPLKIGNSWTYEDVEYDPDYQSEVAFDTLHESITVDTTISATKWFSNSANNSYFSSNSTDGYYVTYKNNDGVFVNSLFFKYPCNINDKYSIFIPDFNETFQITVIQTSIVVSTSAGTFFCYKYEAVSPKLKLEFYITPGKGIIKRVTYNVKPNTETYILFKSKALIKYSIL